MSITPEVPQGDPTPNLLVYFAVMGVLLVILAHRLVSPYYPDIAAFFLALGIRGRTVIDALFFWLPKSRKPH